MNPQRRRAKQRTRRKWRVRKRLRGDADQPRLCVSRSHKHISAQVINDLDGKTLAAASTLEKTLATSIKYGGNREAAAAVGKAVAERATQLGIKAVNFDRGPFKYHGRVAALADAAREAGLQF